MAKKTKASSLSIEERLEQALIPNWDEPYKLPDNWCWTKIGVVSNLYRGVSYKKHEGHSEKGKDDCLVMRGGNIQEGKIDIDSDNIYVSKELISDEQHIRKHDVVIVSSTGSTKVIGRAGISFADYDDVAFGAFLTLVRPIERVYKPYVAYFFQGDMYRNRMRQLASGVNINNIRNEYITDTPFPMPPLEEQKRIVSHIESLFAKLDEAKEKAQEVVDGFETRKAAILHKAFSGELTTKWREENNISFKDWETRPLSQIATVVSGFAFSSSDFNSQNTVPCIKITNVGVGEYLSDEYEFLPEAYLNEYEKFIVNEGDILISLTRSYINAGLKVCISEETRSSLLNQRVAMIKNCNIRYIYYFLRSDKVLSYVKKKSKTTNQPNLSIKDLNNLTVPMACPEEQFEIVRIVDNLVSKEQVAKETAEAVIEQIDTMKKAILARAFRGELGTNDPNEESAVELVKEVLLKSDDSQSQEKPKRKRITIPKEVADLLTTQLEKTIIKLFYKSENGTVSVGDIMSVSSKKFEIMDTIRSLKEKKIIRENIEQIHENNESVFTLMR